MKNFNSLLIFAFLFLTFSTSNLNAATVTANANGYWYNNIWSNGTGPVAGDDIIIPAGVKVYLNTLIDLTTPSNSTATTITIDGELIFFDAAIFCTLNCEVGLKLDENSTVIVNHELGIDEDELGGNAGQYIYFGNTLINDLSFPFGPGTISSAGALLPVELIGFEGAIEARSNKLTWKTATEENTSHFVIERSNDGISNYTEVGNVRARGFSTVTQTYSFEDKDNQKMSYYRLKIVDFDGYTDYSDIVVLERKAEAANVDVAIFPNPVIEDVNVSVNLEKASTVEISIFDPAGRIVQNNIMNMERGINTVAFNMNGLGHQLYIINIAYDNTVVSKKVMTTK